MTIEDVLNETVDVLRKQNINKYNEPQYNYYTRDVDCRLEKITQVVKKDQGEDQVCDALLFIKGNEDIEENDKVETEDEETYIVTQVEEIKDLDGTLFHKELKLRFTDA